MLVHILLPEVFKLVSRALIVTFLVLVYPLHVLNQTRIRELLIDGLFVLTKRIRVVVTFAITIGPLEHPKSAYFSVPIIPFKLLVLRTISTRFLFQTSHDACKRLWFIAFGSKPIPNLSFVHVVRNGSISTRIV